jgi:spore germination protein YaaH
LLSDASDLSVIVPTWYYLDDAPTAATYGLGTPPLGSAATVTTAHNEGVQVWPMIGSISVAPFENASAISATVASIVTTVNLNDYDGITIDFEPTVDNGLTLTQISQQYTDFVTALGTALKADNKKLMVDVYPYTYPDSPYNFSAIAPYVSDVDIMSYGEFDSSSEAGPTQGSGWDTNIYQSALASIPADQIIMGLGPYGDYWSFNNSGLDQGVPLGDDSYVTDAEVVQLLQSNSAIVPVWDPEYDSEVFMTDEYLTNSGSWAVNPQATAVAPTEMLSIADESQVLPQVQNLQGLLNYILLRYAVDHDQTLPSFLNLAQDGQYGPLTTAAVTQFQEDFDVPEATPGVYGPSTEATLTQVISAWNIGQYQYWVDTTASLEQRITAIALGYHLAGIAIWRLPFESQDFWSMIESSLLNP